MNKSTQGPLVHIVKRGSMPWWFGWCVRGAALIIALVACGLISSLLTGEDPIEL